MSREQNLGAAELNSRLTNPELLIESGIRLLEKYHSDYTAMIRYYEEGIPSGLPAGKTSLQVMDALTFLDDRLGSFFPEFGEKLKEVNSLSQEKALITRLNETNNFLRMGKAFADLTKE